MSDNQGYDDIKVVEANRQQAFVQDLHAGQEQNAIWTNKVGAGLKLDIGDTISLHSAYVSEVGAQESEIEIEGKNFAKIGDTPNTMTFDYHVAESVGTKNSYAVLDLGNPQRVYTEYNAEKVSASSTTFNLNDTQINILVSPYKTANGEFCVMLPRRHFSTKTQTSPVHENDNSWDVVDNFTEGGDVYWTDVEPFRYNINDARPMVTPSTTASAYGNPLPGKGFTSYRVKNRTDNSRYTLMTSDTTRNASGELEVPLPLTRDIAISKTWYQVKYPIQLEVSKGFNSPSNIAEQLTTQLNQRTPYEAVRRPIGWSLETGINTDITAITETPSYKAWNCMRAGANDFENYNEYDDQEDSIGAYHYFDSYQNIAVKRPDLFLAGRELNDPFGIKFGRPGIETALAPDAGKGPPTGGAYLMTRENSRTDELITELEWTEANLQKFVKFFKTQENYPELFDYLYWSENTEKFTTDPEKANYQTLENSRFLHMNRFGYWVASDPALPMLDTPNSGGTALGGPPLKNDILGDDGYNQDGGVSDWNTGLTLQQAGSAPFFISYDPNSPYLNELDTPADPDAFPDEILPGAGNNINSLGYGFALKRWFEGKWRIAFTPELTLPVGSLCPRWFYWGDSPDSAQEDYEVYLNGETWADPNIITGFRRFGFDYHFNAYGNPCMAITNGQTGQWGGTYGGGEGGAGGPDATKEMYGYSSEKQKTPPPADPRQARAYQMEKYMNQLYLGANKPLINFDTAQSRFTISGLHTPEYIGNLWNAGKLTQELGASKAEVVVPENPSADSECYKINKQLLRTNYNPDMSSYNTTADLINIPGTPTGYKTELTIHNFNIDTQTVFDATSGLFIEDFGMSEEYWDKSLWGLMGFTYDQFHPKNPTNKQTRITNEQTANDMGTPTTCQRITMSDSLEWTRNIFDKPTFEPRPSTFQVPYSHTATFPADWFHNVTPEIVVSGSSVAITAGRLPTKTLRPYFTIRSDIIQQSNFIGSNDSGQPLQVIGIVDKMNGQGDFFFQQSSELVFTNTIPRTINMIKTSIHDPDGRLANVDKNSSVLYRINKHINADLTPVNTLMESKKKIDKETIQALNQDLEL